MDYSDLTINEAARAIRDGEVSSVEFTQSCLERIDAHEKEIQAWIHLDPEHALTQAGEADRIRQAGHPLGPLHGIPIGVKDLFDTKDMPAEAGSPLHAGRTPVKDAHVVSLLRQAGAIIMGKTVTTELGTYTPGKTHNPHDSKRTPGGSSSGSAAAVASFMVPGAIGTQTNGSVIRPASYCGVYGYVPSRGLLSRYRLLKLSSTLDRIGVFGRTVEDVAMLARPMMSYDGRDPAMQPRARPDLTGGVASEPPVKLHFACIRTSAWDEAAPETEEAFGELVEHLGDHADLLDLSDAFREVHDWFDTVYLSELADSMAPVFDDGRDKMSDQLCGMIEQGQKILAGDYLHALDRMNATGKVLDDIFADYDGILTPSAAGEAPEGLESTGNPIFSTIWSYCGLPALSLPLLQGPNDLPVGVQLLTGHLDDARLMRNGAWLARSIEE